MNQWKQKAKGINSVLYFNYGAGWRHLSQSQQSALRAEQVLLVLFAQALPEYGPAQEMARALLAALGEETK